MKNISRYTVLSICFLLQFELNASAQKLDSLDMMIGQMIMVGFGGTSAHDDTLLMNDIEEGYLGGVVLYEKNISPNNPWLGLKNLNISLQKNAQIPLFIAIDQEGGKVNRMKTKYGFPPSVTAAYLGETNNQDTTQLYAELTASTLAGLGFNLNFAPVVDLATNTSNPIIAGVERSYSADADRVIQHATYVIAAHRKYNVGTSLKHFPGHGSSTSDTHLGMADVTNSWDTVELEPYRSLIDSALVDAIMTAHIINKSLDPASLPATLSKPIITGILRDSLEFNGVIFSDDMHMHAIGKYYGTEEAVFMAINAGLDVLIFSNNISTSNSSASREIHGYIRKMVDDGRLNESRIRESYNRIIRFKEKYVNLSY
jgi:beta-N-acetylhexosaminidase